MSYAFITTEDQSLWPIDENLVFINGWLLPERTDKFTAENFFVEPSPSTREQLFLKSNSIYEAISTDLADYLNYYHCLTKPKRYWEIIFGVWLRTFIDSVITRCHTVEELIRTHESIRIVPFNPTRGEQIHSTLSEFQSAMKSVAWNSSIYLDLFELYCKKSSIKELDYIRPEIEITPPLKRFGPTYISSSYLPRKIEVSLALRLRTIPHRIKRISIENCTIDSKTRAQALANAASKDFYANAVRSLIFRNLPLSYLENFNNLIKTSLTHFPKTPPKCIFTANRHLYDDAFNIWAAEMVNRGSKLVLAQHGGHFGISKFPSFAERQELAAADRYLTWGWSSSSRCFPSFVLTQAGKTSSAASNKHNLVVVTDHVWSHPRSAFLDLAENGNYLEFVSSLVNSLGPSVQKETILRLHHGHDETGKSQKLWWGQHAPSIQQDDGLMQFLKLLKQAKLVLTCHNGTTFPETINTGVPTVIAWDSSFVSLRSDAEEVFSLLEKAQIFHQNPEVAAEFINSIWDDVDGWWNSHDVISARNQFTNQFARSTEHPVKYMVKALRF